MTETENGHQHETLTSKWQEQIGGHMTWNRHNHSQFYLESEIDAVHGQTSLPMTELGYSPTSHTTRKG